MLTVQCLASYLLPQVLHHLPEPKTHPLGCHRGPTDPLLVLTVILFKLSTGASWELLSQIYPVSDRTLRRYYNTWSKYGVFGLLHEHTLEAYDKIIGIDSKRILVDSTKFNVQNGGPAAGPNPTNMGKPGGKSCIITDGNGIPLVFTIEKANKSDMVTLNDGLVLLDQKWVNSEYTEFWAGRGYDSNTNRELILTYQMVPVIAKRTRPGKKHQSLGLRWPIECMNELLKRYSQTANTHYRDKDRLLGWWQLAASVMMLKRLLRWNHGWRTA